MELDAMGTVLGVWAHPDDEAYLSAGLMGALIDSGHRVAVATATYGELGVPEPDGVSTEQVAAMRRGELVASLGHVGVLNHRSLGFMDGACAAVLPAVGSKAVAEVIAEVQPDTILTFGPDGMTGHPDHRTVSSWTTAAWRASGRRGRLLYATLTPGFHEEWRALNERVGLWMSGNGPVTPEDELALYVELTGAELDRKIAAVRAHTSQTSELVEVVGPETFRRWWSAEAFVAAESSLEAER
ncbi:PIG-L deacetylase family protein [Kribbella catacumbae]|uniref:PIG-L deacetylase family protein n=1 Tax=Kribbella catacumbae TaxID=460086 RepID=UPI0005918302|nr:PIG-L deacetylase family protein [Kribbella catacumbae]